MKRIHQRMRRAFTLIELTVGIMVGMTVATLLMTLFRQHLAFLQIYSAQVFITQEAPVISSYVSCMVGKADRFRLHNTLADAQAGVNAVTTNARVVVLNFRQPDRAGQPDEMRTTILSFETPAVGQPLRLNYYIVPSTGPIGAPQFSITRLAGNLRPTDVRFAIELGVLRMRLTGPNGEVITYSGSMQQ